MDSLQTIQERLQSLLDEGRLLRHSLEQLVTDSDFLLTRDSDGDPRLLKLRRPPTKRRKRR